MHRALITLEKHFEKVLKTHTSPAKHSILRPGIGLEDFEWMAYVLVKCSLFMQLVTSIGAIIEHTLVQYGKQSCSY